MTFSGISIPKKGATFAGDAKGILMEELEKLTLNKHIATIHCSNNISLLQRKIYNVLLYRAYDRLLENDFHYISLSDLSKIAGYNSKDTAKLKKSFKGLQETTVEWNILEHSKIGNIGSDNVIWCSSTLLASTEINTKNNLCQYEFSRKLAELLYQPEVYARIDLKIQTRFKSNYALALYENCLRFKKVKTTGWISYGDFRKLMGVSESKYKKFNDFNRRVLSVAIYEVNSVSDIKIFVNIRRVSQKVVAIKFGIDTARRSSEKIFSLDKNQLKDDAENTELQDIICKDFRTSLQSASSITQSYEIDYIKKKINIVKNMSTYKNGQVRSPIALLKSALAENYSESTNKENISNQAKRKKISISQNQAYADYLLSETIEAFNALSFDKQAKILSSFEEYYHQLSQSDMSCKLVVELFKKNGHRFVKKELSDFIKKNYWNIVSGPKTIEQFLDIPEIHGQL